MKYAVLVATFALAATGPQASIEKGHSIHFGEPAFAPGLRKVILPGGDTRKVALVDADTQDTQIVTGFRESDRSSAGPDEGVSSADACRGLIYVTDATADLLYVVEPLSKRIVASVAVASRPDHVRFVTGANEIWVTEPDSQRIEIFALPARPIPRPMHARFITVAGGPESLQIDPTRGRAYANLSAGTTLCINISNDKTVGRCRTAADILAVWFWISSMASYLPRAMMEA